MAETFLFEPKQARPAPISEAGWWQWPRQHLFGSVTNTLVTLLCLYVLYRLVPPIVNWVLVDATFSGIDRTACQASPGGACWTFIKIRFTQIMFGLYFGSNPDQLWRPILSFAILGGMIGWLVAPRTQYKVPVSLFALFGFPIFAYGVIEGEHFVLLSAFVIMAGIIVWRVSEITSNQLLIGASALLILMMMTVAMTQYSGLFLFLGVSLLGGLIAWLASEQAINRRIALVLVAVNTVLMAVSYIWNFGLTLYPAYLILAILFGLLASQYANGNTLIGVFSSFALAAVCYGFGIPLFAFAASVVVAALIAWMASQNARQPLAMGAVMFLGLVSLNYTLLLGEPFTLPAAPTNEWGGFLLTVSLAGVGIAASLPLGIILALGRRSNLPVIRALSIAYIELWRGAPLITVLFMASVMLPLFFPSEVDFNKVVRAMVGITLFEAAYAAEVVRGGLQALPRGQYEAADALGLSYWKKMVLVILPQSLKISIPGIVNTAVSLFKDTSLVAIIGLLDLLNMSLRSARSLEWKGYDLEAHIFAAMIFWICTFSMSRYSQHVERTLDKSKRK